MEDSHFACGGTKSCLPGHTPVRLMIPKSHLPVPSASPSPFYNKNYTQDSFITKHHLTNVLAFFTLPLPNSLSACTFVDLILKKTGDQIGIQFDVSPTITSFFIVVGRRKNSDNLILT